MIAPREQDHEYDVDHRGDLFYILTNDKGRNFRLVTAPVADPGARTGRSSCPTATTSCSRTSTSSPTGPSSPSARTRCRASGSLDARRRSGYRVEFPEAIYSVGAAEQPRVRHARRSASSTSPSRRRRPSTTTTWRRKARKLLKQQEVLGGYDPSRYTSERRYATAADGTKVPISLVYKKGFVADGKAPAAPDGYGSYGAP